MGKRYYCDYCDRSFVDDYEARKKHLFGSMHLRLRKEHYDTFRDAKTILAEETSKIQCKRFLSTGECVFGGNCRYSHYLPEQLYHLRLQVEKEEKPKENMGSNVPTLAAWMQKRGTLHLPKSSTEEKPKVLMSWYLPSTLDGRMDLPPSLQPLCVEHFTNSDFESWG